jgi:DNA-3-methyladenine glycosylase II
MAEASIVKQRIAREHGEPTAYRETFPSPLRLLTLERFSGLPPVKINRLRAIAQAALDGRLDASHLRSLEVSTAIEDLQEIEGVGPFTAELVLVRGAGHPDVFPLHERRLHAAMRLAYGRGDADVEELAKLAQAWAPYRSWVSFLFRSKAAQNG